MTYAFASQHQSLAGRHLLSQLEILADHLSPQLCIQQENVVCEALLCKCQSNLAVHAAVNSKLPMHSTVDCLCGLCSTMSCRIFKSCMQSTLNKLQLLAILQDATNPQHKPRSGLGGAKCSNDQQNITHLPST